MIWEIIVGLFLLVYFGDRVSDEIVKVSEKTGIPKIVISIFIVSLSTTLPEITTSALASWRGADGIAIGNAFGSIIANTFLIIGAASLVRPLRVEAVDESMRVSTMLLAAITFLLLLTLDGELSRFDALLLLATYGGYAYYEYRKLKSDNKNDGGAGRGKVSVLSFVKITVFALLMVAGADLVVNGSVELAHHFGVSDLVIGLTIVAVGTSLPEFTNALYAAARDRGEIGMGNILGANVMNALVVTGIAGLIRPIHETVSVGDFGLALAGTLIIMWAVKREKKIPRWVGAVFLVVYVIYTLSLL